MAAQQLKSPDVEMQLKAIAFAVGEYRTLP